MIFQARWTSLNPVYRVGWQITDRSRAHERLSRQAARARAIELLAAVRHTGASPTAWITTRHEFSGACGSA